MPIADVLLRPCSADDLGALETWAPTGDSRTHAQRFARQCAGTSTYYLASLREDPASFVGSAEIRWDGCLDPAVPRCPEINGLQVWPEELQSRGIGTAMLGLLGKEARRRGHHALGLGVGDDGPKRLYRRLGYADTGPDYVDRYTWIDEFHEEHHVAEPVRWMTKELHEGPFVIGIDADGTHTRVGCYGLDGRLLGSATGGGGAPHHNDDARENVHETFSAALRSASLDVSSAAALVAGMAGFSREGSNQHGDNDRFAGFFEIDDLTCTTRVVNVHEASRTWTPPPDALWSVPSSPSPTICHGDPKPENVAWRDAVAVGLFDWDAARPAGPRRTSPTHCCGRSPSTSIPTTSRSRPRSASADASGPQLSSRGTGGTARSTSSRQRSLATSRRSTRSSN